MRERSKGSTASGVVSVAPGRDHANRKSNQQNLGTIHSSNLCTEIIEYTSPDEVAVCNLASIALPAFVNTKEKVYDFQRLYEVTKVI